MTSKEWKIKNKERIKIYNKIYWGKWIEKPGNKEKRKKYFRKRVISEKRKEYIRKHRPKWDKKWRKKNQDKVHFYSRKWKENNKDKIRFYGRKWRENNRDKVRIFEKNRGARERNAVGSFTFQEWEDLKKKCNYTCQMCGKKEPKIKLTIDHIIPISRGGINYINNIQPLCRSCNSIKGIKLLKGR